MKDLIVKLHRRLVPSTESLQLAPYIWLVYLGMFFVSLYFYQAHDNYIWQVVIAIVAFLVIYFHAYHASVVGLYFDLFMICAIGTWMLTITPGASVFFVYAGAFCCRVNQPKHALVLLLSILLYIGLLSWVLSAHAYFYIPATTFTLLIGGLNIYHAEMENKREEIRLSQQEIRSLASTAERERIARDLHDTMGHTLSLLTRKAELAVTLFDHDAEMAKRELGEIEKISRGALQQVREVVTGYRSHDISAELAHAKHVLESNDIQFDYRLNAPTIEENVSQELGVILKELVTNVLKHADASQVRAQVEQEDAEIVMAFEDDGCGRVQDSSNQGFGLQGIQERIVALRGDVQFGLSESHTSSLSGFAVYIRVPSHG